MRWRGGRSRGPASRAVSRRASSDRRVEQPGPRGGELEREREPGEPPAGGGDRRRLVGFGAPSGADPLGTVQEQRGRGGGRPVGTVAHLQGVDGVLRLAAHPQRGAAGRQHGQVRHGLHQGGDVRRGVEEVLDVVQHEQQVLPAQPVDEVVGHRSAGVADGTHRLRDGREHLVDLQQRRQLHESYAVGVALLHRGRRGQGQAGLAHPAGSAQGHQPAGPEQVADACDVVVAPDERRGGCGQGARGARGGGAGSRARGSRRDRAQQGRALVVVELQRSSQGAQGVGVGTGAGPALERADGVGAEGGPLGELLLGQPGGLPHGTQDRPERVRADVAHQRLPCGAVPVSVVRARAPRVEVFPSSSARSAPVPAQAL